MAAIAAIAAGYRGYVCWRVAHLEKQAAEFHDRHDDRSAVLVCRRLLQLKTNDATACRLMGEIALTAGRPEAIEWLRRLVAVQPTTENRLELAAAAIARRDVKLATSTLDQIPESERSSAHFHELAGALAIGKNQNSNALEHFSIAEKLDPHNVQVKFDRAAIELAFGGNKAEKARADLSELTKDRAMHLNALRALLSESIARHDEGAQENLEKQLRQDSQATFADGLLCLESARARHQENETLAQLKTVAEKSPALVATLVSWMNRNDRAQQALEWIDTLPAGVARTQPVPLALAESYSCTRRWLTLRTFVESDDWKNLEPLRLIIAHHSVRQLQGENSVTANSLWRQAITAAHNNSDQLLTMAGMCRGWGYDAKADEAYWLVASGNAKAETALGALQHHYQERRDACGLLRVAQRAADLNPDDAIANNNCASLGLLLNDDAASHRLAEKLHEDFPQSAAFASTYAFALHLEGRSDDALKLLGQFKSQLSKSPALAAYYVVISAGNGNAEAARQFRALAERAHLLPEEENLLRLAVAKL